jgi:hypothetical protein
MQASVDNIQQTIVYDGIAGALTPPPPPPPPSLSIDSYTPPMWKLYQF